MSSRLYLASQYSCRHLCQRHKLTPTSEAACEDEIGVD